MTTALNQKIYVDILGNVTCLEPSRSSEGFSMYEALPDQAQGIETARVSDVILDEGQFIVRLKGGAYLAPNNALTLRKEEACRFPNRVKAIDAEIVYIQSCLYV